MGFNIVRRAAVTALVAGSIAVAGTAALAQDQAAGAAAAADENSGNWIKVCGEAQVSAEEKRNICSTLIEQVHTLSGAVIAAANIRKIDGVEKTAFQVTMGYHLAQLGFIMPAGIRVRFDDEQEAVALPFLTCNQGGCTAEGEATEEIVNKLKAGKVIRVVAVDALQRPREYLLPLKGFTRAYESDGMSTEQYAKIMQGLQVQIAKRQQQFIQARREAAAKKQAEQGGEAATNQ